MQALKNTKMSLKSVTKSNIAMKEEKKYSFIEKIIIKVKNYFLTTNEIEEVKMERKEIKNFNRKVNAQRAEINSNVRMHMFQR